MEAKDHEMQALRNEILETKAAQQLKDRHIQVLVESVKELDSQMKYWLNKTAEYEHEIGLSSKTKKRIAELKKQLDDLPDDGEDFEDFEDTYIPTSSRLPENKKP
jgi:chromosome segregation ATPase